MKVIYAFSDDRKQAVFHIHYKKIYYNETFYSYFVMYCHAHLTCVSVTKKGCVY